MSFRGSPTRKLIKRIFPFTGFGLLYLVLALGVLAAGILRMELATLLWSSAFLLLACYSLSPVTRWRVPFSPWKFIFRTEITCHQLDYASPLP